MRCLLRRIALDRTCNASNAEALKFGHDMCCRV